MSRYRLLPTPAQEAVLREHCAHARYVWNLAVEQYSHWRPGRKGAPGYLEQCRQLTESRKEHPWLAAGSQTVQQQALRDFAQAMTAFFDRYRRGVPQHRDRLWQRAFDETELFTPLDTASFPHVQRLDLEGLRDRAMSVSFIAALPPEDLSAVRGELLGLLPSGVERVGLPYRCEVSWCERR